jgi:hypothetical protein
VPKPVVPAGAAQAGDATGGSFNARHPPISEGERSAALGPDAKPGVPTAVHLEAVSFGVGSDGTKPSAAAPNSSASASRPHWDAVPAADETAQVPTVATPCSLITLAQVQAALGWR